MFKLFFVLNQNFILSVSSIWTARSYGYFSWEKNDATSLRRPILYNITNQFYSLEYLERFLENDVNHENIVSLLMLMR